MPDPDRPLPALLPPDLRPVPAPFETAWALIQEREPERMVRALYLVAQGLSPYSATPLAGYDATSAVHVYRKAQHYGMYRPKAEQIAQQALAAAHISGEQMLDDLLTPEGQLPAAQRMIRYGITQDKAVAIHKAQQGPDPSKYGSALEQLLSDHLERGGSFSLQVNAPDPLDHAKPVSSDHD